MSVSDGALVDMQWDLAAMTIKQRSFVLPQSGKR